ncbi:MAG: hypothetical protein MK042_11730 [Cognatishimia sp.]|nr:hypothetical protein [Cognatishimia sp.]
MPVEPLDFADPFFSVELIENEATYSVSGKAIVLNLSETPIQIREQSLAHLQSVIVADVTLSNLSHAVIIGGIDAHTDELALMEQVRATWPSAFDVRGEERLRGISHYMSKKVWRGQFGFTMYHSGSVPLNVGLHKDHNFCPVPGFREVHTQIMGFGKMQQCREKDVSTLYLEEPMAPGTTHRPMYDAEGNFPWHQFETITPSIFMAVEMLPEGASPPA